MTRTFIIHGTRARGDGKFTLKDMPGSGGRIDVLVRSLSSSFVLSNDIRRDVVTYLSLAGGAEPVLVRIDGIDLKNLNPDERTTGALLRHSLIRGGDEDWVCTGPGIYVRNGDLISLLEELKGRNMYYLDMDGDTIDTNELVEDPVFILGDDKGLTTELSETVVAIAKPISIGPIEYHTDQCISFLNILLDK